MRHHHHTPPWVTMPHKIGCTILQCTKHCRMRHTQQQYYGLARQSEAAVQTSAPPNTVPCRGLLCGPCFYISSPSTCHRTRGSCQHHTLPCGCDNVIELHMIVSDVQVCLFGHWFAMSRYCGLPLVPVVDAALTKQESRCTY